MKKNRGELITVMIIGTFIGYAIAVCLYEVVNV